MPKYAYIGITYSGLKMPIYAQRGLFRLKQA